MDNGFTTTPEAVAAHCAERLAAFKIPSDIWIVATRLPRNASGKILKRDVFAALAATIG